jgi:hypothetical protein
MGAHLGLYRRSPRTRRAPRSEDEGCSTGVVWCDDKSLDGITKGNRASPVLLDPGPRHLAQRLCGDGLQPHLVCLTLVAHETTSPSHLLMHGEGLIEGCVASGKSMVHTWWRRRQLLYRAARGEAAL